MIAPFRVAAAGMLASIALPNGAAAQEVGPVEVTVTHLAGPVYLFGVPGDGSPVNQLVSAGIDGILMVDMSGEWRTMQPRPAQVRAVKDSLRRFGDLSLRYLINSHWHGDHTGSNAEFHGPG